MKKFKMLLSISNELKFDLRTKLTIIILIVSLMQINANTYSLNSNNSFEIEKGYSQQNIVNGKVTDAYGVPLPGASVQVKGTTVGAATDFDGNYSITIPDNGKTLVISYLGFVTKEVIINDQSIINVSLSEDNNNLDEVVVVGYGVQRKRDLVGAISQVKTDDLILSSTPSIGHILQGKAAGLQITQNSAQPGGGIDIFVRGAASINGSNAPLIVVDGFPLTGLEEPGDGNRFSGGTQGILNSFNPNDIESIEVLKDASSSAIYGLRAANGVIIITTKKGKAGKINVDYSTSSSFQSYEDNYEVLSASEYMQLRNEATFENWAFLNRVTPYASGQENSRTLEEAIADPVNGIAFSRFYSDDQINNAGEGTNWLDLITREGIVKQHNLSINGGTESTRYYLSGNLFEHQGVLKNSEFERSSLRLNLDQKINDYINVGMTLTKSTINNDNTQLGGQAFENSGIIRSAIQTTPLIDAIDEFGNYPINPDNATTSNPASMLTITDQGKTDRTLANFYLEVKPIEGLVARFSGGVDQGVSSRYTYLPRTTLWGELENGRASISNTIQNDKLLDFTLTYNTTFNEAHKLTAMVGASYQKEEDYGEALQNNDFITDAFLWNSIDSAAGVASVDSFRSESELASVFGRINYVYKDRYLLTATVRRDGSGKFFKENQYDIFPSIALGWNIAEEPFMESVSDKVSQFKLRAGYGEVGNQAIPANAKAALIALNAWLNPDESILTGVFYDRIANPFLQWETTKETNIGLDFGFFNNRVSGSIEYFDRKISNLLDEKALNSYQVVSIVNANIGSTQSKGLEITLNSVNVRTENFSWRSTLTYSSYDDRWLERAPDWKPAVYQEVNDPIRANHSYLSDGIMQIGEVVPAQPDLFPGQIKIKDVNGFVRDGSGNPVVDENGIFQRTGAPDGQIDIADTVLLGSSDPDFIAGFTNVITYKNIQLNFHFNGMFGREIVDATDVAYGVSADGVAIQGNNALVNILNRWTPENPSTTRPGSHYGFSNYGSGDFFLQDAWFIRLQNISLSYQFPKEIFGKNSSSSAALRLGAQNLFVITPYKGADPETNGYDPDVISTGGDPSNLVASYPNVRTFTIGLDLKF
ncbi:TonB-dependent receptor [Flavivirga aquimarina]|uniref:TonB-dependent receptor n=1 Tax=Flavivirga aquimarina TaxID=2027862 RepID=A0ABT8W788_9FLAO|nr:TonB-dependent receptor [Flavivirga aquimarina]MDO5968978.1 TonB-dependent receptor [Flavivirga aquimarina]